MWSRWNYWCEDALGWACENAPGILIGFNVLFWPAFAIFAVLR